MHIVFFAIENINWLYKAKKTFIFSLGFVLSMVLLMIMGLNHQLLIAGCVTPMLQPMIGLKVLKQVRFNVEKDDKKTLFVNLTQIFLYYFRVQSAVQPISRKPIIVFRVGNRRRDCNRCCGSIYCTGGHRGFGIR